MIGRVEVISLLQETHRYVLDLPCIGLELLEFPGRRIFGAGGYAGFKFSDGMQPPSTSTSTSISDSILLSRASTRYPKAFSNHSLIASHTIS